MRPLRGAVWGCALILSAATAGEASAAWNNVFQVCCFNCRSSTSSAYFAPVAPAASCCAPACPQPCAPACPQQTCTTRYVTRSYYQPVTTMRTSCYLEPVTTMRTSFYWEPVTSWRTSCYFDPCTCSYQQVATPCTSYQLRSQCCPVTSYLQRTCQTPVTTYRQMFYYEPVTTCCTTSVGAPVAAAAPCENSAAPAAPPCTNGAPPAVTEQRAPAAAVPPANPPSVQDSRDQPPASTDSMKRSNGTNYPPMQPVPEGSSYRQPQFTAPAAPARARPSVRLDRIVALPGHNLEGQVVASNRKPLSGARLLFVNAERQGTRQAITADEAGKFRVALASGSWLVYTHDLDGRPVFSQKVETSESGAMHVMLLSR